MTTTLEIIARQMAQAIAEAHVFSPSEAATSLVFPSGFEDFDPLDLNRTAVFEVLRVLGSDDPDAWMSLLGVLLSAFGDRFLEVCDGRL